MKVDVLSFDGVEELDFAGPYEVFGPVRQCLHGGRLP